jgi:uncharacterized protein (DUF433 family)
MSTASTQYQYLAPNPKSAYKQLFIKGTRIRARVLYGQTVNEEPRTVEEVAEDYGLPVEAVREAVAYCESNPPEIREDYEREERLMEATGMNEPGYKGKPRLLSAEEWARLNR